MAHIVHGPVRMSINGKPLTGVRSIQFQRMDSAAIQFSAAADRADRMLKQLGDAYERHAPVGNWELVRKVDRWFQERERKRMASYRSNWSTHYSTSNTNAYTIQNYSVPYGTTSVSYPQFNYNSSDWYDFERERQPPPREFNRYVNGSDLLEEFIGWLGTQGVRQSEFMALPIELFIKWLIVRACEEDHEEPPEQVAIPAPPPQPRCLGCQRFMARRTKVPFHGTRCAEYHFARERERSKIPA